MKKIAFIHESLVTGGAEKSLINLLHYIDYEKYDVTLWLRDDQGELLPQVDSRVKIRFWKEYLEQDYKQLLQRLLKKGCVFSAMISSVCRLLSKSYLQNWHLNYKFFIRSLLPADQTCYDVAISYHSLIRDDIMFLSYAIKAKKKIGWIHGKCRHDQDDPYFEPFSREYPKLDHIFCVSNDSRKLFLEKYPMLSEKTSVMYNLQNFDEIMTLANEKVEESFAQLTLVTVGRLAPEKGQDMIPAIAEKLRSRGHRFVWYLVGDGPIRTSLEQEIVRRDMGDTVFLLGQKMNPYPYIKNCSLYVQPSYSEGFCVTTFEAKILCKSVVVTNVSGMSEQFSHDEAVFCDPEVESLTDGIERAICKLESNDYCLRSVSADFNQREIEKLYAVIEE